jgi:hypothetical protein
MTPAEIITKWNQYGAQTRNDGHKMHHSIEQLINFGAEDENCSIPELLQFKAFYRDQVQSKGMACKTYSMFIVVCIVNASGLTPFRTEWRIAVPAGNLAGSVDFIARYPNGTLALFDWKRSSKFRSWSDAYGKKCKCVAVALIISVFSVCVMSCFVQVSHQSPSGLRCIEAFSTAKYVSIYSATILWVQGFVHDVGSVPSGL